MRPEHSKVQVLSRWAQYAHISFWKEELSSETGTKYDPKSPNSKVFCLDSLVLRRIVVGDHSVVVWLLSVYDFVILWQRGSDFSQV